MLITFIVLTVGVAMLQGGHPGIKRIRVGRNIAKKKQAVIPITREGLFSEEEFQERQEAVERGDDKAVRRIDDHALLKKEIERQVLLKEREAA